MNTAFIVMGVIYSLTLAGFGLFVWFIFMPVLRTMLAKVSPELLPVLSPPPRAVTTQEDEIKEKERAMREEYDRLILQGFADDREAAPFLDEEMHPKER